MLGRSRSVGSRSSECLSGVNAENSGMGEKELEPAVRHVSSQSLSE